MGDRIGGAASHLTMEEHVAEVLPDADPNLVVGVIDTGVVIADRLPPFEDLGPHPYLDGHLAPGWREQEDKASPLRGPLDGHGTFVAGVILHNAPTAMISMRNALDTSDDKGAADKAVAAAIRDLSTVVNLKVVNLSFFGKPGEEREEPPEIKAALYELLEAHREIVIVIAAGNAWTDAETFPACFNQDFDQVIAVGAVDETVIPLTPSVPPKASFSNFGAWVDAYAPGVNILGPRFDYDPGTRRIEPGWGRWSGTSFAAATVTGLIAAAMKDGTKGLEAKEKVLSGRKVPVPGVPEEHWAPYVHGATSWPYP